MIQGTIYDVIQIHLNQSSKTFFTSNDFNFARVYPFICLYPNG